MLRRAKVEEAVTSFVSHLAYVALMAFVILAALSNIGIQTASFIAVLGAAGLAVGLAFQGSLSNFASGVLMIMFKPFKVGDFVTAGGVDGGDYDPLPATGCPHGKAIGVVLPAITRWDRRPADA